MKKTSDAWLVVNGFIDSPKFRQLFACLEESAKRQGCTLEIQTNKQLLTELVIGAPDIFNQKDRPGFVLFWDKDIHLARLLEKRRRNSGLIEVV